MDREDCNYCHDNNLVKYMRAIPDTRLIFCLECFVKLFGEQEDDQNDMMNFVIEKFGKGVGPSQKVLRAIIDASGAEEHIQQVPIGVDMITKDGIILDKPLPDDWQEDRRRMIEETMSGELHRPLESHSSVFLAMQKAAGNVWDTTTGKWVSTKSKGKITPEKQALIDAGFEIEDSDSSR